MTKSDAVEIIIEVSDMLADNSDYESYIKPRLDELLNYVKD
tara:strand:- start:64 stop:186 length:123 start_codon:yes stop_codon:yes gene_type:complete